MSTQKTPNFICLGAQKAGTTSLHNILDQHPQIYLPAIKETHFFDWEDRYANGIDWILEECYSSYNNESIMGDMTPEYLYDPKVPQRIKKDYGDDIKFVVILRHPVERAFSHYLMTVRRGFENEKFEKAIELEPDRIIKGKFENDYFSYIDRGRYAEQIKRYLDLYSREQFLFLSFENDIRRNLKNTITRILNFLEVEHLELDTSIKSNKAAESRSKSLQKLIRGDNVFKRILKSILPQKMRRSFKQKVIDLNESKSVSNEKLSNERIDEIYSRYYKDEIPALKELTGIDFSYWITNNKA